MRRVAVALLEGAAADLARAGRRPGVGPSEKSGIAVAELLREVEREPLGELDGRADRVAVVREAGGGLLRAEQDALAFPRRSGLAALERRAVLDRDEDVLQARAARMVRVDVAGRDRADAERLRERAQRGVPAGVPALVRPLELDEEAVAAEGAGEVGGGVRVADGEPVARAAGEADEALALLGEQRSGSRRGFSRSCACAAVSRRQRFA